MAAEGFRPLGGRARWVVVALVACIAANVFTIVVDWMDIDLFGRVIDGDEVTQDELDASDTRPAAAALLYLVTLIAAAVLFLGWFHPAYRNLDELAPGARRFATGWAIGAWFFPVLNLWRPKQIANDIWRGSSPDWAQADSSRRLPRPPLLLALWWTTLLVSPFAGNFAGFVDEGTPVSRRDSDWVDLVASALGIVAALLAIAVVRSLTARETERAGTAGAAGPMPAPA